MRDASSEGRERAYAAIIDQNKVTREVRDIALKYDPLQNSPREGFHITQDGELHIDDANVTKAHKIIANKIPNDAIRIVRLPTEQGTLTHQHGPNGFRLYELPAPIEDRILGLLGSNGIGKTTTLKILAGLLTPNLGNIHEDPPEETILQRFRGTPAQAHLTKLQHGDLSTAYKPQRVDHLPKQHDETVRDLIQQRDERNLATTLQESLDLNRLQNRRLSELSGGEIQRVALAATIVQDADMYLFDEPSSYLDVSQRLTMNQHLKNLASQGNVILADHDLITLDIAADDVHLLYGTPGAFGVISRPLTARRGINRFLEGRIPEEDLKLRKEPIQFARRKRQRKPNRAAVRFPQFTKAFETFTLTVQAGTLQEGEVLGILGKNGLGKTTFAKLLAGALTPDTGTLDQDLRVSYKPQLLKATYRGTVHELFKEAINVHDKAFHAEIHQPLNLEPLWEEPVQTLSGGQRQRVAVALALARDADMHLLDEPSAFLDVEQRMALATTLERLTDRRDAPCLIIDHDLLLLDRVADRGMVFKGAPGTKGTGHPPEPWKQSLNRFLSEINLTFRRDPDTHRPRANKPGSRKDREQTSRGEHFAG